MATNTQGSILSFDEALDALAAPKRRRLLVSLLDHDPQRDPPVGIGDSDAEADAVDHLVMMKHGHLPKLEAYGFIEWDRDDHEVMKGPRFDEIRPLLELLSDHRDELPRGWL